LWVALSATTSKHGEMQGFSPWRYIEFGWRFNGEMATFLIRGWWFHRELKF
jgi:hypothetical protein